MTKPSIEPYKTRLSRVRYHLDLYLKEGFENRSMAKLTMPEIRAELRNTTGVKVHTETILNYNTRQFSRYQTAPLEWIGEDIYRLNDNYYRLLQDKVFEPRIGKFGPPKKYTKREKSLDYQI